MRERPVIDASVDVRLTRQTDGCVGRACTRGLAFTKEGGLTAKVPKALPDAWGRQGAGDRGLGPVPAVPTGLLTGASDRP
ncbi:hypothetical protein ABZV75_30240 [Streptomyces flaveolus]|uniref:hypothetical protein n=1 Tax=Streptomyces flaveolus TaxID=67297 RepID=UPI0033A5CE45